MPASFPRNRLGLAKWLVEDTNPLTSRVTVNRFWQEVFGTGLVKTAEDFGSQGEAPSHPELLDWLAVEFRESGWDVKHLFHLMLTSAAYRQSSAVTQDKLDKDGENRLLSRGPRFRMDAEMVRDYALASSGLLASRIGGPSVRPYQPTGVWETVAMKGSNTRFYEPDEPQPVLASTMGIGTILDARLILLQAYGSKKARAIQATVEGPISSFFPASALQFHPQVSCYLDPESASLLTMRDYYRTTRAYEQELRASDRL